MNAEITRGLERDLTIDITTTGRKSGKLRRTEIWSHRAEGRYFITGLLSPRDWYANLLAHAHFTFHLKESVQADLPAKAVPITDPSERRRLLLAIPTIWDRPRPDTIDDRVDRSPLIEVVFTE